MYASKSHVITTIDGQKIDSKIYFNDTSDKYIIYSHGNIGDLDIIETIIDHYLQFGNVITYDYRGYGNSNGSPSENGIYLDLSAVVDYYTNLYNIDPSNLVLWGYSLGCVPTSRYGAENYNKEHKIILQSGFYNFAKIVKDHVSFLPTFLLKNDMNNANNIKTIINKDQINNSTSCNNLLIIHSKFDELISYSHAEQIKSENPCVTLITTYSNHADIKLTPIDVNKVKKFIGE